MARSFRTVKRPVIARYDYLIAILLLHLLTRWLPVSIGHNPVNLLRHRGREIRLLSETAPPAAGFV